VRSWRGRTWVLLALAVVLLIVLALSGLTLLGLQSHHQSDRQTFCFAEWCVTPVALRAQNESIEVDVRVSSQAQAASQRPDHPQAWLGVSGGRATGGPQPALDRVLGPGAAYVAALKFSTAGVRCFTFTVSEGGWPPFLGLGYAPSPFTERADWRLCVTGPSA
jgi:hypothetical protein